MNDNEIYKIIIPYIRSGLATFNIEANVQQSYQPQQQGVPTKSTVFLSKIAAKRYGFLGRFDMYDEDNSKEIHTETQQMETIFQANCLAIQDPLNKSQLTASDILNYVAAILQSSAAIAYFEGLGMGIYRVTDIRNPHFSDDKGRFEASPSFDFTISHKFTVTTEIPVIESRELDIFQI